VLADADLPFEFMLNALRLTHGVPTGLFSEQTGLPLSAITPALAAATRKGLFADDPTRLQASALGLRFLNDLQQLFLET
jgi:coproporphyrinogen III oxidase-like Fe-S oxidoreductase